MNIQWCNSECCLGARINPFESTLTVITVTRREWDGIFGTVQVSWPSIGDTSADRTRLFAEALQKASLIAQVMEQSVHKYKVVCKRLSDGKEVSGTVVGNNEQQVRDSIPEGVEIISIEQVK